MKFIFTIFMSLFLWQNSNGQIIFGPQASIGLNVANDEFAFSGEVFDYINHEMLYKGSNLVKSYGFFAQQKFGFLYGRAELGFTHYKQKYNVRSFVQLGQLPRTEFEKFGFIDFRVMAGLTKNDLRLGVGPVAHILVHNDNTYDYISAYNERHRGITYGFNFAVGIDAGRLHIDVRYEYNFRTIGDHIYFGTRASDFKHKPNIINLCVGVSI